MPVTYEMSFTMRGATGITLQPHQILHLPYKIAIQNVSEIWRKQLKRHLQRAADSTMIRPWSEHEIAKLKLPVRRAYFSPLCNAFCIENYNISRSGYLPKFDRILRLPRKVTCLPRKVTLQMDQIVQLPWRVTKLLLYWTITLLSCYLTERLLLCLAVTWLNCYLTGPLLL